MHRRIWLLAGAVAAVLLLAASASATTDRASSGARVLAAAPFAQAWANVPRTPAARKAKSVLVFGMEQDVTGFNTLQADENAYWAAMPANTPVLRGNYMIDNNGVYHLDMASKVVATPTSLTIDIRPDAYWYWQGHPKMPVTWKDYAYTWQQIMDPKNNVASNTGYNQITGFTHKGLREITFKWKPAFADYRDLFGLILPSQALTGLDFNTFWADCVCGNDGHPISDGPFYLASYTKGQGLTLRPNPLWYGHKPALKEIDFKLITDTNSEIQAMRGGEVDAINPSPQAALAQLMNQSGITYSAVPSYTQEHLDLNVGGGGNALLKQLWFREALARGIFRQDLVHALYSQIAPGMKPLNNPLWNIGPNAVPWFQKDYPFGQKAVVKLFKAHGCTGGPSTPSASNQAVWTCAGQKAEVRFTTTAGNQRRQTSAAIFSQQLMAVGIKLDVNFQPASTYFGQTLPSHNFDIGEYAWVGGPDPSGFDAIYQCVNAAKNLGGSNYKQYCNKTVDALIKKGDSDLNPTTRTATYQKAAQILSHDISIIPLYASPSILVYKSQIKGMKDSNNPTSIGPTWNCEFWSW